MWVLAINFVIDSVVMLSLVFEPSYTVKALILMLSGGTSSLLYYLGATLLPFDLGKIMLLKFNVKVFG